MTSDELLEALVEAENLLGVGDQITMALFSAEARIRELKAEVAHWKYEASSANARIRELEAERDEAVTQMTDKDELLTECYHRLLDAEYLLRKHEVPWTTSRSRMAALMIRLAELKAQEKADE